MKNNNREIYSLDVINKYKISIRKKVITLLFLIVLVLVLSIFSIFVGSSSLTFFDALKAIFNSGTTNASLIVWNIRMPRVIAAIVAGFGLAISGCIMQAVLKNPMASPSTLGVSNAAVFGANVAIIILGAGTFYSTDGTSLTISNPYLVSSVALSFSLIAVLMILAMSKFKNFRPEIVVLAGIAIGSLFSAGTTLIQYFSIDTAVASAVYWTFGDLSRATYNEDLIMFIVVSVSLLAFYSMKWSYNSLRGGETIAQSLGVKLQLVRFISLLLASLITAVSISFLGIIGFLGLVAPQIMKRIIGSDYRFLIPASGIAGSAMLLFSDTISRIIIPGGTLPVGAVTALLGAPLFIYIIFRKGNNKI